MICGLLVGRASVPHDEPVQNPAVGGMHVDDNRIDRNLCVNSISILAQPEPSIAASSAPAPNNETGARTYLSLSGTKVVDNTFMSPSLKQHPERKDKPASTLKPQINLFGFQTGGLIVALGRENSQPYGLITTGMRFDRIFDGDSGCGYGFEINESEGNKHSTSGADKISDTHRFVLPKIPTLLQWLDKGESTQPLASAIDAYQRAGADVTNLQVRKASEDLKNDTREKWDQVESTVSSKRWSANNLARLVVSNAFDWLRIAVTWVLGWVADYGYRPQKAIIFIALSVAFFTLWIRRRLDITHAKTEVQDRMIRVGWVFVLDYMVPGYNIDEAHFKVAEFYFRNGNAIDRLTQERLYRTLRWTKFTGAIATVFVAAALKTLVVG